MTSWPDLLAQRVREQNSNSAALLAGAGFDPALAARLSGPENPPIDWSRDWVEEEAERQQVPSKLLLFLMVRPPRFFFHADPTSERRRRCPLCKKFFEENEPVYSRDGSWIYHPECGQRRTAQLSSDEHKPVESAWHARGRVIRKGDSL